MRLVGFAAAIVACSLVVSACSGSPSSSSPGVVPAQPAGATLGGDASKRSQISFTFTTVDDPASTVNEVTGINATRQIAGEIGSGSVSDPNVGYTSSSPYGTFTNLKYTGAQATFVTSLSSNVSNLIVAGYVVHPPQLAGNWAFVYINGIWTIFKDRKGAKGSSTLTEILGVNNAAYGVGTYTTTTGNNAAVLVNIPTEQFTNLKTPGATNAAGTGINTLNHVTGWETLPSGTVAFFERAGSYYTLSYPNAAVTKALGVNTADQIVGYYQNSAGGTKHGFIMSNPTKTLGQQVWQSIDEPNAASGTVITGVNDSDDICGYFVDSSGIQHGFVAVPTV